MKLRPYQVQAIEETRQRLREGARRVLITCPTGGGKTVVAADIIRRAVERQSRVLFLAHRRELIHQTADKLRRFEVPHGIIMAGTPMALQQPVQVASVQTLGRRRNVLKAVDLVFFDEAHHAAAGTYLEVLSWYPDARVVGLTATPWRLDGKGLADIFDAHVLARTPRELRDEGFLVPVGGWAYESLSTKGARVQGGDFVARDLSAEASKPKLLGNIVNEWLRHAEGKRTVVFAVSVEASQALAAQFRTAGVAAEHLDGETPTHERDAILARLRAGATKVVCNCNVLTEGFDCPELEVCVLARPTLSLSLYLQMVGRVLRPADGKTAARIHDHAGCLRAHGHPYAVRDYSPTDSVKVTRDEVEKPSAQKTCPECGSVRTGWPCDACGHTPTPKERQLEVEEEARRTAIQDEAAAVAQRKTEVLERARRFRQTAEVERRAFFERMKAKHGPRKALGVYRWWSGETAWPPREWSMGGAA